MAAAGSVNTVKAAVAAGVTVRTIYNWMRAGKVKFVVKAGRHRLIRLDSLPRISK